MRIGIDAKTLSKRYTGIAMYVSDMISYFAELDKDDEFFLYSNQPIQLSFTLPHNFHIIQYRAISGTLGLITSLPKILKKDKIDVFWGPEHCLPLGKQSFKRVVTIHDLAVLANYRLGTRYNYLIQRFIAVPSMKCADKVIAISKSTAKDVEKYVDLSKIEVVYNGDSPYKYHLTDFKDEDLVEIFRKYEVAPNSYFLFVSTIEPRKNIVTIINGYNEYKNRTGNGEKLVLAGGLGWRYSKIIKHIKRSPYVHDIVLTGYCSNLEREALYRNCICLVFPSIYEGLGLPLLEAMSVGKPVITSNVSSLPELGGDVAFYINGIYDSHDLSNKMEIVKEMSAEEKSIIYEKSIRQSKKFSKETCAKSILNIFQTL